MTTKADYTAEEWQALVRMPAGASLAGAALPQAARKSAEANNKEPSRKRRIRIPLANHKRFGPA